MTLMYVTAREQLQRIADETGGTLFKANRAEDLEGVYERVSSEPQTLYSVSSNPANKNFDGEWRNVSVKVKQGPAMSRTKRGFYARLSLGNASPINGVAFTKPENATRNRDQTEAKADRTPDLITAIDFLTRTYNRQRLY